MHAIFLFWFTIRNPRQSPSHLVAQRPIRRLAYLLLALCTVLLSGLAPNLNATAQSLITIKYGQTIKGTIGNSSSTDGVIYQFQAHSGDLVLIKMTRTSNNLRPLLGLLDPTQAKGKQVLTTSTLSSDGRSATISDYEIMADGIYEIVATRENVDKGTTSGNFTLTLSNDAKAATATPTPAPQPTDQPTPEAGAATQNFTVGTEPVYSVWSGNNLYVANEADGTVSILTIDGTVTGTIKTGGKPFAMSWDGARLWVADFGTDAAPGTSVNVFDAKGKKLNTVKVGKQPLSLSYDADDILTWVALYGDDKIVAIDARGKIVHTLDVSSEGHNPNTVLWANSEIWATLQGTADTPESKVLRIDPASGQVTATITVGQAPADLAWDDRDGLMFVANSLDGTISAINTSGDVVGTYKVGTSPSALAWDGSHLWVTLATENTVAVVNKNGSVITKVPVDSAPNGITYDGQANVWVALQGSDNQPGNMIVQINIDSAIGSN